MIVGEGGRCMLTHIGGPRFFPEEKFATFKYPKLEQMNHYTQWVDSVFSKAHTGAEFSYAGEEYEGSTREDDLFMVALSVKYMLNRNYFLGAGYRFQRRESTVATSEYDQSVFTVRFGLQF